MITKIIKQSLVRTHVRFTLSCDFVIWNNYTNDSLIIKWSARKVLNIFNISGMTL